MKAFAGAVRQFVLTDANMVLEATADWNARCAPPWTGRELAHKVDEAINRSNIPWNAGTVDIRYRLTTVPGTDGSNVGPAPVITIGTDLARVVDQGADVLGRAANLYQRGGEARPHRLRGRYAEADAVNVEGAPTIRSVPPSTLKAVLTAVADWQRQKEVKSKDGLPEWKTVATTPSDDVVAAVSHLISPNWTTRYRAAFTAADLAARWGLGAATLTSLGPSPSSATTFDNTSGTFNTLVAACATAISACAAPTNGQPPLNNLSAEVTAAKTALQEAWEGGPPSDEPETKPPT